MGQNLQQLVKRNKEKLAQLEAALGYRFTDLRLLQTSLIHSSFAFEYGMAGENNERLEFLGDAVLDVVVGYLLMNTYKEMREGELTRLRASLVNEHHLASLAEEINLGVFLELGKGEEASNGRKKSRILSCAWEAVAGAIFEDSDYGVVSEVMTPFFTPSLKEKKEELLIADAKSRLQEELQDIFCEAPTYAIDSESGPDHAKIFAVSVHFQGKVLGKGTAGSKKEAEQRAAADALRKKLWQRQ